MKTILHLAALAFFLLAPRTCFALMEIADVSTEDARKMGLEFKVQPSGPDHLVVTLEFDLKADLKKFERVELEFSGEGKTLLSSILREERPKPEHVVVRFYAARAHLPQTTLRIVAGDPGNFVGYDIKVKDFVDLAKLR